MNAKKLIALVCALAMVFSFAGTAFAADEKTPIEITDLDRKSADVKFDSEADGVSVDFDKIKMEHDVYYDYTPNVVRAEVGEANVVDQDNVDVKPYASYKVSYEYDEEYSYECYVSVEMEGIKLHQSQGAGKGFWTGFSIEAPKDAKYLQYYKSFGQSSYDTIEVTEGEKTNFYLNVAECDMWEYAAITWLDADGNDIVDEAYYYIDLSHIKLPADEYEFGTANVCDSYPGEEGAPAEVFRAVFLYKIQNLCYTVNATQTKYF